MADSQDLITIDEVRSDAEIMAFIAAANAQLRILGYTEHGHQHASRIGKVAADILCQLGRPDREAEQAHMPGYLHDVRLS